MAVIDRCPLFRRGLTALLTAAADFELSGTTRSIDDFRALGCTDVHLVVLGLDLPGPRGTVTVEQAVCPEHALFVVSSSTDRADLVAAMTAGASGYVSRMIEEAELLRALRAVAAGETYVSTTLPGSHTTSHPLGITRRETQILELVAAGKTDDEISDHLQISVCTVRSHLDRIRDKTGARRRADLTRFALERGPDL